MTQELVVPATVTVKNLKKAFNFIKPVFSKTLHLMECVRFSPHPNGMAVYATNMSEQRTSVIDCYQAFEPFIIHNSAVKKALEFEGAIEFHVLADKVIIKGAFGSIQTARLAENDYPIVTPAMIFDTHEGDVEAEKLLNLARFCSKEEYRPAMTGIFFDEEFVTTDGYRMGKFKVATPASAPMIFPPVAVKGFKGVVSITRDKESVCFTDGVNFSVAKLIDERYPAYKNVIPKGLPKKLTFNAEDMLKALSSHNPAKDSPQVRILFDEGSAKIYSTNDGEETTSSCPFSGDAIHIAFNVKYLREALDKEKEVTMSFENDVRATIFEGKQWTLLMPMRMA